MERELKRVREGGLGGAAAPGEALHELRGALGQFLRAATGTFQ